MYFLCVKPVNKLCFFIDFFSTPSWDFPTFESPNFKQLSMKQISTLILIAFLAVNIDGIAATLQYTGGAWTGGNPPSASTSGDDVEILDGTATFTAGWKMNNLTIKSGAAVEFTTSGTITVGGNLLIENTGALTITSSGSFSVAGTSTVEITGSNSPNAYNTWSSMFSGLNIESTMGNPNPCDIYHFDSKLQAWKYDYAMPYPTICNSNNITFDSTHAITDGTADGNFDVGLGYFIPGDTSTTTRSFTGTIGQEPFSGNLVVQVNGTSIAIAGGNDWNLLGNPYPSGLSIDQFLTDNSSLIVGTAVYIFHSGNGSYDGPYSNGDGQILAAGQGFMIDPNTTTDGDVGDATFSNAQRSTDNSTFRSNNFQQAFIALENSTGRKDKFRVMLDMNCSNDLDHVRDARKLSNWSGLNFGGYIDTTVYAINGIKPIALNESFTMDLFVEIPEAGTYMVSIDSIQNIDNHSWIIKDKLTGFSHNLNDSPFSISVNSAMEFKNRYQLIITNQDWTTSTANIEKQWFSLVNANNNLFIDGLGNSLSEVTVLDLSGRTVISKKATGSTINISTSQMPTGIYLVTITNQNGNAHTLKVVVQ